MEPNSSSYKPFLIGQGNSKVGLFTYLESWIKPDTAFDTLENAYVYRGSLYQRQGMSLFPSTSGAGALVYQNNQIVGSGDTSSSYTSGTGSSVNLSAFPIFGTVTITALTAAGIRSSTATGNPGDGTVNWSTNAGDLATDGNINFDTGAWTIDTSAAIANNIPIVIQYNYVPTALTTPVNNPIMGLKLHQRDNVNVQDLVAIDTRRLSYWDTNTRSFVPVQSFQQILWVSDGTATTTGPITIQWTDLAPYSITVTDPTGAVIQDRPTNSTQGTFRHNGNALPDGTNFAATSSIFYNTGIITIDFVAAPALGSVITITGRLQGDYFSGNNSNFFNSTNWQTDDNQPAYLYLTNNVDFVTLFDGTNLARPPFATTIQHMIQSTGTKIPLYPFQNDVENVLDVKVYKNRLIFFRPTIIGQTVDAQSILWSKDASEAFPLANFNFVNDVAGNGGELAAPTGDWIQCAEFLRDALIVFFQFSTWLFRFTGNTKDLFRFDKINGSRSTNAPYASVEYDAICTSMGAKGLIACNGVTVDRYDESIIDFIEEINQNSFDLCYAIKYDTTNQTFMLYPADSRDNATSDSILVYNFLENTWAKFKPSLGQLIQDPTTPNTLSCLGIAFSTSDMRWQDFAVGSGFFNGKGLTWSQAVNPWNSFAEQDLSPTLVGGDQNGYVYTLLDGPTDMPGPESAAAMGIPTLVRTQRLNPFVANGVKARFGYLDVYYEVNDPVQVTFNFYLNNSTAASITKSFTFDGQANQTWNWKRIYISAVGEFLQIEIDSTIGVDPDTKEPIYNTAGSFKILGMILWAGPSGRLTPGLFL